MTATIGILRSKTDNDLYSAVAAVGIITALAKAKYPATCFVDIEAEADGSFEVPAAEIDALVLSGSIHTTYNIENLKAVKAKNVYICDASLPFTPSEEDVSSGAWAEVQKTILGAMPIVQLTQVPGRTFHLLIEKDVPNNICGAAVWLLTHWLNIDIQDVSPVLLAAVGAEDSQTSLSPQFLMKDAVRQSVARLSAGTDTYGGIRKLFDSGEVSEKDYSIIESIAAMAQPSVAAITVEAKVGELAGFVVQTDVANLSIKTRALVDLLGHFNKRVVAAKTKASAGEASAANIPETAKFGIVWSYTSINHRTVTVLSLAFPSNGEGKVVMYEDLLRLLAAQGSVHTINSLSNNYFEFLIPRVVPPPSSWLNLGEVLAFPEAPVPADSASTSAAEPTSTTA